MDLTYIYGMEESLGDYHFSLRTFLNSAGLLSVDLTNEYFAH